MLLGCGILLILLAGWGPALLRRHPGSTDRFARWTLVAGGVVAATPALLTLAGASWEPWLPETSPGQSIPFGLDPLSAWFVVLVLGAGVTTGVYGFPYLAAERDHRPVPLAHGLYTVLLGAIVAVVTASTVVAFLAAWEIMAVSAYLLVVFESEKPETRRAGLIYIALTHVTTLCLLVMFAAWTPTGITASFRTLATAAGSAGFPLGLVLVLALIAFGIKAGVVPGHFWLPGAHAAAPSHVSALLSGVMIKTGIYGLLRIITLLGAAAPPPPWWGWTLLLLGLASAVLGVLWALAQHDVKRLLAYHSVENIGIILLGLGVGVLGSAYGHPAVAFLGYAGALLHTLNHALFKSLLFLGAGAVVRATGTREIDRLGGLARPMPGTALAFLVGAVAIVGLPPLNGFVSEWVIFQGLLEGGASRGAMRGAIVGVAGLALTGALALACFTKLYGTLFLGRPRDARLPDGPMIETGLCGPQFALAAACVLLGVIPAVAVVPAVTVTRSLLPLSLGPASLPPPIQGIGQVTLMALGVVGLVLLLALLNGSRLGRLTRPTVPTWACAYPRGSGRMQYTAASYASPLLQAFGPLSGIRQERGPTAMRGHPFDLVLDVFGRPAWGLVQAAATRLRVLQAGRIRWYLLYLVLTLLALLLFLRSAPLR